MKFSVYIALRFITSKVKTGTSRITGMFAIVGMGIGTLALVLSVAILNGFEEQVQKSILAFDGELRIMKSKGQLPAISELDFSGIKEIMPYQERKGLIVESQENHRMVSFKAVDFSKLHTFYPFQLIDSNKEYNDKSIIIGQILANRLGLNVGDWVKILSPIDSPAHFGFPQQFQVQIVGIFQAQVLDYDDRIVFIPLSLGKKLFLRKKGYDGYDLRLTAGTEPEKLKQILLNQYSDICRIETWEELHQSLFQAMQMEKLGAIFVLSLIILVASFNLTSTLVMIIYRKIREIGILRTMGATIKSIQKILLTLGFLIGGIGALMGLLIGISIVFMQSKYQWIPLPTDIYSMDALPMRLYLEDIIIIPIIAVILIGFSTIISARRATLIQPKEAVYLER